MVDPVTVRLGDGGGSTSIDRDRLKAVHARGADSLEQDQVAGKADDRGPTGSGVGIEVGDPRKPRTVRIDLVELLAVAAAGAVHVANAVKDDDTSIRD